jgi:hypothetical protein
LGEQFGPAQSGGKIQGQAGKSGESFLEPAFEFPPFLAGGQKEDAETDFSQNDGIEDQISFVALKPCQNAGARRRFGGLAEDVGVHEVFHSRSVDSEGMGWK